MPQLPTGESIRKRRVALRRKAPAYSLFRYRCPPVNTWTFFGLILTAPRFVWTPSPKGNRKISRLSFRIRVENERGAKPTELWVSMFGKRAYEMHLAGLLQWDQVMGIGRLDCYQKDGEDMYGVSVRELWVVPRASDAVRVGEKYLVDAGAMDELAKQLTGRVEFNPVAIQGILDRMSVFDVNHTDGTSKEAGPGEEEGLPVDGV